MSQTCTKCQRINPGEAVYCYWDGALLQGHSGNGPVNPGVLPFPSPFVFPSGQSCQNFDQLAMACQNYWKDAIDLLKKGFLGGFFGGLGRADLAMAAQEAAQFPDQDRGLDQLLAKIPSKALETPRLKVEPREVNLGTVPMGTDRQFELHLANQGMRLLFGSIASDSKWLTIGEAPGQNQRIFQFRDETTIPVQIRGKELRAGAKALEGNLFVDSNGGQQIQVKVALEVPVKPFADGVLAGALTPRQIAEKAKGNPKEAAAMFEHGAVARWFAENGWIYPVQGPSASGLGAVQQFFEALGLAKAPKVVIDKQALALQGPPNQALQTTLEVKTDEKRPVYAHATANVPWLDVNQVKLAGRSAVITVRVPSVPYSPGQILSARIRVAANGNQRFEVPLNLTVISGPAMPWAPMPAAPGMAVPMSAEPILAIPTEPVLAAPTQPVMGVPYQPVGTVPAVPPTYTVPSVPVYAAPTAAVMEGDPFASFATGAVPVGEFVSGVPSSQGRPSRLVRQSPTPMALHVIPLLLLLLALLGTVVKDFFVASKAPAAEGIPILADPWIEVAYDSLERLRFGVVKILNPGQKNSPKKKLTFDETGLSNSTVVRIDNKDVTFANQTAGRWEKNPTKYGKHGGFKGIWLYEKSLKITQFVEKVPGDPFLNDGKLVRAVDTCLVKYEIENLDKADHVVGLRVLLDTLIGANDGAPFTIAGESALVDKQKNFSTADTIPDFVQALEKPDLQDPGVVVRLKLRHQDLESPTRLLLTRWPALNDKQKLFEWDVPMEDFTIDKGASDSAAVIYWDPRPLAPGKSRTVGFAYGLVHLVTGAGGLGATYSGDPAPNKKITITAYVSQPQVDETLTLQLPDGMKLMDGSVATQKVSMPRGSLMTNPNPITWNVMATTTGSFAVTISSNKNRSVQISLGISAGGIFGGS